jgi:hypothetical protein
MSSASGDIVAVWKSFKTQTTNYWQSRIIIAKFPD